MPNLFAFILGKNPELSAAEIVSYIFSRSGDFSVLAYEKEFLVLEIKSNLLPKVDDLGGTIKICKVLHVAETIPDLDAKSFFNLSKNSINFGLSFYNVPVWEPLNETLSEKFKKQLREEGVKAGIVHLPEGRSFLTHVETINKKLVENGEAVFCFSRGKYFIGKTIQVHNPFEFQKRDVGRPDQRPIFSIPPRLAKIMVNLLGITEGIVLDPFCGIGTILQEAVLNGFDIRGTDLDKNCIASARKNLEWLKKEYSIELKELDKKIISGDSRHLSKYFEKESIDGIATEPYLGPPLRGHIDKAQANKIISGLEELYRKTLQEAHKVLKPGGRVCIISPKIKMKNSGVGLDMEKLATETGYKTIDSLKNTIPHAFPLTDSEERHRLIGEINVLEKV